MGSIITSIARTKLAEARAGIRGLPQIDGMAFGDGAVDASGNVLAPIGTELRHEIHRKKVDGYTKISNTCYRYSCTLTSTELAGKGINEIALYDTDDELILIKSFTTKTKDSGMIMVFQIDDQF